MINFMLILICYQLTDSLINFVIGDTTLVSDSCTSLNTTIAVVFLIIIVTVLILVIVTTLIYWSYNRRKGEFMPVNCKDNSNVTMSRITAGNLNIAIGI